MDRAKLLFFNNNGIKHWMWHDGILDEYNSYLISKEQENIWYEELQLQRLTELQNGADPDIIYRQLEAICVEIANDKYIQQAIDFFRKSKKDTGNYL